MGDANQVTVNMCLINTQRRRGYCIYSHGVFTIAVKTYKLRCPYAVLVCCSHQSQSQLYSTLPSQSPHQHNYGISPCRSCPQSVLGIPNYDFCLTFWSHHSSCWRQVLWVSYLRSTAATVFYKNELQQTPPTPLPLKNVQTAVAVMHSAQKWKEHFSPKLCVMLCYLSPDAALCVPGVILSLCQIVPVVFQESALLSWASWGIETALFSSSHSVSLSAPSPLPYPPHTRKCLFQSRWGGTPKNKNKNRKKHQAWQGQLMRRDERSWAWHIQALHGCLCCDVL